MTSTTMFPTNTISGVALPEYALHESQNPERKGHNAMVYAVVVAGRITSIGDWEESTRYYGEAREAFVEPDGVVLLVAMEVIANGQDYDFY